MSDTTLPTKIVQILTSTVDPTASISLSANAILALLNEGVAENQTLDIKALRPRLSEMKTKGLLVKTEGGESTNGKGRRISEWKLANV